MSNHQDEIQEPDKSTFYVDQILGLTESDEQAETERNLRSLPTRRRVPSFLWQPESSRSVHLEREPQEQSYYEGGQIRTKTQPVAVARLIPDEPVDTLHQHIATAVREQVDRRIIDLLLQRVEQNSSRPNPCRSYEAQYNKLGGACTLLGLGTLESQLGNVDAARQHYSNALSLFEAEHNRLGKANSLLGLGLLERQLGNVDAARKYYDKALPFYEAELLQLGEADALRSLGDLEI